MKPDFILHQMDSFSWSPLINDSQHIMPYGQGLGHYIHDSIVRFRFHDSWGRFVIKWSPFIAFHDSCLYMMGFSFKMMRYEAPQGGVNHPKEGRWNNDLIFRLSSITIIHWASILIFRSFSCLKFIDSLGLSLYLTIRWV